MYAFAKKHQNHAYISEFEAKLWQGLEDNENGVEVLSNTMRVLGNYSLADGIRAGEVWTIEDQNNVISCLENIDQRLEEHTENEYGDPLFQGDMAATRAGCHYSEHDKKIAEELFPVGTRGCNGLSGCQFEHPDEAVHFCNNQPECTLIMGKLDANGCDGGFGCYVPKKGLPKNDETWSASGGKTFMKHCPGVLTQVENAMKQGLREAGSRWNDGVINYCFSADVMDVGQEAFHLAVEAVKRQVPCLTFNLAARVNDTHCNIIPSIMVTSTRTGCWSYVGQVSGKERGWLHRSQPLNLDRGCQISGLALHQLSHALGMVHQTARGDRDEYVTWNENNTKEGREMEFSVSEDVVKYGWHGFEQCKSRAGRTRLTMNASDCLKVQGSPSGSGDIVECQLDLCEDGIYFPAPMNVCKEKVAQVAIMLKRKDCQDAKGVPAASGSGGEEPNSEDWVDCHFDFCTDMGLHLAKPYSCANKLAYGYIETTLNDCRNMKGSYSMSKDSDPTSGSTNWANCYFDFCAGVFDAPFDFLSLMAYSPFTWSKLSPEGKPLGRTLMPKGDYGERIATIMGQRMGYSGLDAFRLGHMYGCWDKIKPDFDSQDISHRIVTGEFFQYEKRCEDVLPEHTGFDVHGESGFMKHASCNELEPHCKSETIGDDVKVSCPVTCFECMPGNWLLNGSRGGACFDAINTGIRFRDGPKATCSDLRNYCNHSAIGPQVQEACKISCGLCDLHVEGPFLDTWGVCEDEETESEPHFTIGGKAASCPDMEQFCYDHPESYLVRHKCRKTCGGCGLDDTTTTPWKTDEIHIPGDEGNCDRRRRFGFCSSRRRRNV